MRLINADKLIDNLDAMIPFDDCSDRVMGKADAIQEIGRMALEEEVKAIPIEWIVGWLTKQTIPATHTCDDYEAVEMMLKDWEKENERNV